MLKSCVLTRTLLSFFCLDAKEPKNHGYVVICVRLRRNRGKNKLAPQNKKHAGLKQYFFLIAVSAPSLKTRKFRLRPKNKKLELIYLVHHVILSKNL